ncbi:hypothetical protein NQZ68_026320 [Dissostichus eleginoides]|nr:hypothetical protein NQZ68_026320 [Dissostichus eleginoides]
MKCYVEKKAISGVVHLELLKHCEATSAKPTECLLARLDCSRKVSPLRIIQLRKNSSGCSHCGGSTGVSSIKLLNMTMQHLHLLRTITLFSGYSPITNPNPGQVLHNSHLPKTLTTDPGVDRPSGDPGHFPVA